MKKHSILTDSRFFWESLLLFTTGAVLNGFVCLFFNSSKLHFFWLIELISIALLCLLSLTVRNFLKRRATQFVIMSKRISDLEMILENIPSVVIGLDKNGGITFANKAAEKILEGNEAEVFKKNLNGFVRSTNEANMRLSGLIKSIRSIKGPVYFNNSKIESRSSKKFLISGFLCPVHYSGSTGALLIFNDETDRKLKENEFLINSDKLKERYEILRKTLSVLPLGVLVTDPRTSEVIYANRMFRQIHDIPDSVPVSKSTLFKLLSSNFSYRQCLINSHNRSQITSDECNDWSTNNFFTMNGESRTIRLNSRINPESKIKVISVIVEEKGRDYNKNFFTKLKEDYECVLQRSIDGIVIIDNLGKVVCWNAEMVHLTGIDYSDALNKPIWEIESEIVQCETANNPDNIISDFLKSVKIFSLSSVKKDEQWTEIKRIVNVCSKEVSQVKIFHNFYMLNNSVRICRIYRNLSGLVDIQRQLVNQRAFISNLLTACVDLLYIYDFFIKRLIFISGSKMKDFAESMIYLERELSVESSVHPDDINSTLQYLEDLKAAKNNELSHLLYRADYCDGQWKWFLRRDMIYSRDADGSVKQILGSITDITMSEKWRFEIKRLETVSQQAKSNSNL